MPLKPQLTSDDCYRAYLLIELLRSTGEREFPLQLASVLFFVMSHDGCRMGDLATATGLSSASVTRNIQWLGEQHRIDERSGLKLVRREQDPDDYKRFRLFLTPKGKSWVNLITNIHSMPLQTLKNHDEDNWENQNLG